ncbi:MAG TPA: sigma 54-interacting transcriptional regulator [Clostridia bacterium]|nr:sigma 54-interacting transcriptional regulator [Clostridia bacterium]
MLADGTCQQVDRCLFGLICRHSYEEIWVTDKNGFTVYVNPACERYYGVKAEFFLGKNVRELEKHGYFYPAIAPLVMEQKREITHIQQTCVGKVLLVTASPVFDENGEIMLVIENSRDITAFEEMRKDFANSSSVVRGYGYSIESPGEVINDPWVMFYSPSMRELRTVALKAAQGDVSVLITGETGTGKSILAKYIHRHSKRASGPFLTVSCPAIPESLFESELFGYRAGAFTGAKYGGKPGLFQLAEKGTVFLDEIGDMPLSIQAKLLHVLEEREFIPVGGSRPVQVDVRVIAATNKDLSALTASGRFRSDLFFRLNVIHIHLPPLRDREEEIAEFIGFFLRRLCDRYQTTKVISPKAVDALTKYPWPGNVRELEHVLESLFFTCDSTIIREQDLPEHILANCGKSVETSRHRNSRSSTKRAPTRAFTFTKEELLDLYNSYGSTYKVAKITGLSQSTVYRRLKEVIRRQKE